MVDAPLVKEGEKVKEGQAIGNVGSTGSSEAPHLHYEIQKKDENGNWVRINPVVGDQDKVNTSDNVELKDPQQMINERDGTVTRPTTWKDVSEAWKSMLQEFRSLKNAIDDIKN